MYDQVIHSSLNACAFKWVYGKSEDEFSNVRSILELKTLDTINLVGCHVQYRSVCIYSDR